MAPDDIMTPPAWTVTGQLETADIGPQGTYVPGVKVTFRLASGQTGSVFVAQADYAVDAVARAIADKVATMTAVAQLQG